jgi:hypothetical protein
MNCIYSYILIFNNLKTLFKQDWFLFNTICVIELFKVINQIFIFFHFLHLDTFY